MIVDALLDLLVDQGADALILKPDQAPVLSRAGTTMALSMPGIAADVLKEVLASVTSDDERGSLAKSGSLRTEYRGFAVLVETHGAGHRFTFRKQTAGTRVTPAEVPTVPPTPTQDAVVRRVAPMPVDAMPAAAAGATDASLSGLLQRARSQDASDVILSTGLNARLRVGGELIEVQGTATTRERLLAFLGDTFDERARESLEATGSADLAFVNGGERFRVNVFRQIGGLAAAFRPIRVDPPTLRQLGLPEELYRLIEYRNGLVLMTGTAGSGKSTTLVALLERLNRTLPKHVITLEDPIEYLYGRGAAMIHQREVGVHVDSFSSGLRAALRESPDVILLGEMRDRDTIAAALTAAETGHLVLSTLHCADAGMAVDRIIDVFPEHQQAQVRDQLAGALRAVVTQNLLPSTTPPTRVPAFEKLIVNTAVATKIRERRGHQMRSEIQTGRAEGMVPMELTLARLLREHRISKATALAYAPDRETLQSYLRGG